MLPTYVIAGTVRSGTTSLHRLLRQHPDVSVSAAKELHFFDRNFDRGLDWYEGWFEQARPGQAVGEASPNYVYHPPAIERMAATLPHARVVVLLRNPVDRAYSQYWMHRTSGHETLSFEAALEAEPRRLASGDTRTRDLFSYIDRGRYLDQLRHLRRHYRAEQTLVLLYEELSERPDDVYVAVCDFLGVRSDFHPARLNDRANQHRSYRSSRVRRMTGRVRAHGRVGQVAAHVLASVNSRPVRYPPMSPHARSMLDTLFEEPNAKLAAWLGRDLHEWAPVRARGAPSG